MKSKICGKHMHNLYKCCVQLVLQWMFCNVYPQTIAGIAKYVTKFWIIQHWNDYENLLLNCKWICLTLRLLRKGLCIKRNSGELKWLILIRNFMKKQKLVPCVGYFSTLVDQKWEISHKRKLSCKNRSRNESY